MEKGLIVALKSRFDTIAHVDEESGIEFWYARELQKELGYQRLNVITIFVRSRKWLPLVVRPKEVCSQ